MSEVWKSIPNYEGLYEISNYGRVKSINYQRTGREKILKPFNNKCGYLGVYLHINNKVKGFLVHRLMALVFLGEPPTPEQNQVNHKTENPADNFICINPDGSVNKEKSTLEWCDSKYNNNYGSRTEKIIKALTNRSESSKPVEQILNGGIIATYPSIREAERQTGISSGSISRVCRGKFKQAGGYIWRYVKSITA